MIRRIIYTFLFFIGFNATEHFCHKKTEGFSISRIQFKQEGKSATNPPPYEIHPILKQPFHYLDCGNQCFAFLSEDGKYVLKFFKYVDHKAPAWTSKIPLLNRLKPFRLKRQKKITWKKKRDFQGYQLAFDHFRQETGLLWIHLSPSQKVYPTIKLYDKLHIGHFLDLNTTPFVLQKRATPIFSQFSTWLQKGDLDKVKQGISHLISLCAQRLSKNIEDDDVHFYSNFGFVGDDPIQVDPGHFVMNVSPNKQEELRELSLELKDWFSKNYPPLIDYVESCALSY